MPQKEDISALLEGLQLQVWGKMLRAVLTHPRFLGQLVAQGVYGKLTVIEVSVSMRSGSPVCGRGAEGHKHG